MTLTQSLKFPAVLAAATLAMAASSQAALVVADFSENPYVLSQVNTYIGIDVVNGTASYSVTGQFIMSFQNSSENHPFFWPMSLSQSVLATTGDYTPMLQPGDQIDPAGTYSWGPYMAFGDQGPWAEGGNGQIAFRVENGVGGYNYGFADVSYDPIAGTLSLNGFAYDNTGAVVTTSPIPESSALFLAGAGVVTGLLRRRRKA